MMVGSTWITNTVPMGIIWPVTESITSMWPRAGSTYCTRSWLVR